MVGNHSRRTKMSGIAFVTYTTFVGIVEDKVDGSLCGFEKGTSGVW